MKFKKYILEDAMLNKWKKEYPEIFSHFDKAKGTKELTKLKKEAYKKGDSGEWKFGPIDAAWKEKKKELTINRSNRSASDARMDRILRTRDSSGKAKTRKW